MMLSKTKISSYGRQRILVLSLAFFAAVGLMQTNLLAAIEPVPAFEAEKLTPEAKNKLKFASRQHDLILLLIENQDFDSIEPKWKQVLDLKLGAEFESLIAKSLVAICYNLLDAKRSALGLKLIDDSLTAVPFSDKSRADIFGCQAALYKDTGDLNSAIKAMKKAQELEGKP